MKTSYFTHIGLATLSALSWACGAPKQVATAGLDRAGSLYEQTCSKLAADHDKEVAAKDYAPVELMVHQWPSDATPTTADVKAPHSFLKESDFVAALTGPGTRIRTALVMARGGTGKSKLAESLSAQTCKKVPVFRVDLNTDVAFKLDSNPAGQNGIAVAIARQLQLDTTAGAEAAYRGALGDRTVVVILDSLDEVPLMQRQQVVAHVDAFVTKVAPHAHAMVMTRPPVFTANYGLETVDARLEIPGLTCDESEAAVAQKVKDPAELANFKEFTKRYGLDRKVTVFDRCYFPHLSTYRDIEVVQRVAHNSMPPGGEKPKVFASSRAQVYAYFAQAQLLKDLQGVPAMPADILTIIDRMVDAKKPSAGQRNLAYTLQDCVAVAEGDAGQKQAVCERLFQSSLFKASEPDLFRMQNQSLGDLFLARWTHAQIVHNNKADCTAIAKLADLLESNEVAGFLVGYGGGQKCFAQLAVELTKRSGCAPSIFEMLDQGLPAGEERKTILDDADLELHRLQPSVCVTSLMENLGRGLPQDPVVAKPAPQPTEVPADKAGKKGKKNK